MERSEIKEILFTPFKLSSKIILKNKIVMAPLTRSRATSGDLCVTPAHATHYGRRAMAGLIITEATIISPDGQGYPNVPGIFTTKQIDSWKQVTNAIRPTGAKIFLQIWHVGRVSHSSFLRGNLPIAPSALKISGSLPRMRHLKYETPRPLRTSEVSGYVDLYKQAAKNAKEAGFDGVEIHGANGYLIDQFLHFSSNCRHDCYGRRIEDKARFVLEVVDSVCEIWGNERVGLRLSPAAYFNMKVDMRDKQVFDYLIEKLNKRKLAYLHAGIFDDSIKFPVLENQEVTSYLKDKSSAPILGCGSYSPERAARLVRESKIDFAAFGRPFISQFDFANKIWQEESNFRPYTQECLQEY